MAETEVARILREIDAAYQAAEWALTGLACGMARGSRAVRLLLPVSQFERGMMNNKAQGPIPRVPFDLSELQGIERVLWASLHSLRRLAVSPKNVKPAGESVTHEKECRKR